MEANNFMIFPYNHTMSGKLFLGIDFLRKNKLLLRVKDRVLVKTMPDSSKVEMFIDSCGRIDRNLYSNICCFATEDVNVSSGTAKNVPINFCLPTVGPDHMLLYSDDDLDRNLRDRVRGLSGIVNVESKKILFVAGDGACTIKKGQMLGKIASVVELPSEDNEDLWSYSKVADSSSPLDQIKLPNLTLQQQTEVFKVLNAAKPVFSCGDYDVGQANVTEHTIRLSNDTPIYQRPRRFPSPIMNEIEKQCQELRSLDIIEPSISPWNSPIVPVLKIGGGLRMCLDYRKLNLVTVPD